MVGILIAGFAADDAFVAMRIPRWNLADRYVKPFFASLSVFGVGAWLVRYSWHQLFGSKIALFTLSELYNCTIFAFIAVLMTATFVFALNAVDKKYYERNRRIQQERWREEEELCGGQREERFESVPWLVPAKVCAHPEYALIVIQGGEDMNKVKCTLCGRIPRNSELPKMEDEDIGGF